MLPPRGQALDLHTRALQLEEYSRAAFDIFDLVLINVFI